MVLDSTPAGIPSTWTMNETELLRPGFSSRLTGRIEKTAVLTSVMR